MGYTSQQPGQNPPMGNAMNNPGTAGILGLYFFIMIIVKVGRLLFMLLLRCSYLDDILQLPINDHL